MLDFENTNVFAAVYLMANSIAFKEAGDKEEFLVSLWDFVEPISKQPIFWIMKDKAKCEASKLVANLTLDKVVGADKDYDAAARHFREGVNKILKIRCGEKAFDIVAKHSEVLTKLIKKTDDMYNKEISLLIASAGLAIREELLINGLYKGPLR